MQEKAGDGGRDNASNVGAEPGFTCSDTSDSRCETDCTSMQRCEGVSVNMSSSVEESTSSSVEESTSSSVEESASGSVTQLTALLQG
eukprot:3722745-Pleurochrysis_carterae.AAC.1